MEAAKSYEDEMIDDRSDLQELEDLIVKMRKYRRKLERMVENALINGLKKGAKKSEDETYEVQELWRIYSYYEKSYNSLHKLVYPKGAKQASSTPESNVGGIKKETSSIGSIVRQIPANK